MKRFVFFLASMLIILSAGAQSATGDKDKKKSSAGEVKTAGAPTAEKVQNPPEGENNKSSGIPNVVPVGIPAGSQVEVPKVDSPK